MCVNVVAKSIRITCVDSLSVIDRLKWTQLREVQLQVEARRIGIRR